MYKRAGIQLLTMITASNIVDESDLWYRYGTSQHPKLLEELNAIDIVVTMGCNVNCSYLPCKHREDWGLEDPTGKSDEEFKKIIKKIEKIILNLK